MRIPRIYQATKFSAGITVSLTADAANHVARVLRLTVGSELRLFNGEGGEYAAKIVEINKKQVLVQIGEYFAVNTESPLKIHLGQAISRGEKMDFVMQKAVELGVTSITPIITERCGVKLSEERWNKRVQHWRAVAVSACEQCGRDKLPIIAEPILLADWLKQANTGVQLVLDPDAGQTLRTIFPIGAGNNTLIKDVTLLIGPEGGLSEMEIELAKQNNFTSLNLGPRILRTETAGIAAIAALQSWLGDFV